MNAIDKIIGYFNPKAGFKRVQSRARMEAMQNQVRRYEGAAEGRRHSGWLTQTNPNVNDLISKDHENLVNRSRELSINNPYAKKAPITIANNVVGTGIIPTPYILELPKSGEKGNVRPATGNEGLVKSIQSLWKLWAENTSCDHDGDNTFYGIQYLMIRTIVVSGEALAIRRRVKAEENIVGLQIQVVEGDFIDTSKDTKSDPGGGFTLRGVVYDSKGKKTHYWIWDKHPSDGTAKSNKVEIKDIVHVYDVERVGQSRGVPFSAATLLKQRDVDDYEDAELLGKKAQACMPVFVTKPAVEEQDPNADEEPIESIEPGAVNYLRNGEEVTMAAPPASTGFESFVKTQHRGIAAGYLMTYELLTGDLSNVNFSSGRMGALEFQKVVEYWQHLMFIPKACDKMYAWFIEAAKVIIQIDDSFIVRANWTPPRREMIDPLKEITAKRLAMRSGLQSWQSAVKEDGYNPEELFAEIKAAHELFKAAGLHPEFDPGLEVPKTNAVEASDNQQSEKE